MIPTQIHEKNVRSLTGSVAAIPIMFLEQKSQNLMKDGSNDAYGSKTLSFQRAAKLAHIGRSSGHFYVLALFRGKNGLFLISCKISNLRLKITLNSNSWIKTIMKPKKFRDCNVFQHNHMLRSRRGSIEVYSIIAILLKPANKFWAYCIVRKIVEIPYILE